MYSKIGENIIRMVKNSICWLLYESTWPRRWIWKRFYELTAWVYPEDSFYIMNSGYALLSEDGLMNKFSPLEHEKVDIYQYQLYYAVTSLVNKSAIRNKKIIDLSCGRGGGTYFTYSLYKPKKIYGIDSAWCNIKACRETFVEEEQKILLRKRKKLRHTIAKKFSLSEAEIKNIQNSNRNRTKSMNVSSSLMMSNNYFEDKKVDPFFQNDVVPADKIAKIKETDDETEESDHDLKFHEAGQECRDNLSRRQADSWEESSAESLLQKIDDLCELEYIVGEAETLHSQFPRNSIDCILSIESSHCYGDLDAFFRSNYLMLKPTSLNNSVLSGFDRTNINSEQTGLFLFADYFDEDQVEEVKSSLKKYFSIEKVENITANVFHAVKIDGLKRKERMINHLNWYFRPIFRRFYHFYQNLHYGRNSKSKSGGLSGRSEIESEKLSNPSECSKVYYAFVLRKN